MSTVKFRETESGKVDARGWGEWNAELLLNAYGVLVGFTEDENVLEMDGGDGLQQCKHMDEHNKRNI